MKEKRIKMLAECLEKIKEVQENYVGASSGWVLLRAAWGHISSLHHLESDTNFDDDTLGVK
jgi:hypothetical protein